VAEKHRRILAKPTKKKPLREIYVVGHGDQKWSLVDYVAIRGDASPFDGNTAYWWLCPLCQGLSPQRAMNTALILNGGKIECTDANNV
jgi:hypothetical protein